MDGQLDHDQVETVFAGQFTSILQRGKLQIQQRNMCEGMEEQKKLANGFYIKIHPDFLSKFFILYSISAVTVI